MEYFLKLILGYFLSFSIFYFINKRYDLTERLRKKFYPSRKKRYFLKYTLMFLVYVVFLSAVATILKIPSQYLYIFSGVIIGSGFYIIPYPNAHLLTETNVKKQKVKKSKGKK